MPGKCNHLALAAFVAAPIATSNAILISAVRPPAVSLVPNSTIFAPVHSGAAFVPNSIGPVPVFALHDSAFFFPFDRILRFVIDLF